MGAVGRAQGSFGKVVIAYAENGKEYAIKVPARNTDTPLFTHCATRTPSAPLFFHLHPARTGQHVVSQPQLHAISPSLNVGFAAETRPTLNPQPPSNEFYNQPHATLNPISHRSLSPVSPHR
jgi:hypothetical protein